ncbi:MAG: VWA domain-containing protein, partial [Pirellulaceae bacterium]|nr:VWA domain-containing protein [Pirellulaceae bacterium]
MEIGNPTYSWLILFSLLAVGLMIWNGWSKQQSIRKFAASSQLKGVLPTSSGRIAVLSTLLLASGLVLLVVALLDIRWGKTTHDVPQKGIEVVFALDVSRSMLAEDASPSRLERAKQQIKDMLEEMAGDRVGLVVFAGDANQAVPLTSHYGDFRQVLDSVGPHSVSRGGSQLGVAIQAASKAFLGKTDDHKTIVIFTDGEDQESRPVELAKALHQENGTRIFTVGLGDMDQGARIPDQKSQGAQFVEHQGEQVWSKLNGRVLRDIATETKAAYIPAGTKRVNMADVYHGYVAQVEQTEFESSQVNAYIPRFQWFAALALICFLSEIMVTTRSRNAATVGVVDEEARNAEPARPRKKDRAAGNPVAKAATAAAILLVAVFAKTSTAQEIDVINQINAGNDLVRQQKPMEAIEVLTAIDDIDLSIEPKFNYNLAVAHYRNSDYPSAMTLFGESAKSDDSQIAADSRYNLGNCHYAQAIEQMEQDPAVAVEQLLQAIEQYRSALRLDSENGDARANIELASELIKQLNDQQDQQQQDQQQQDQQQQDQQQQDQQQQDQQQQDQQQQDQQQQDQQQQDQQ